MRVPLSDIVIFAIPAHKISHAGLDRGVRLEAGEPSSRLAVGEGARHVAGLHRHVVADRFLAERALDRLDEVEQLDRLAVADIDDAKRRGRAEAERRRRSPRTGACGTAVGAAARSP